MPPAEELQLPVTGLILAGGRSTRFGSDKASALLEGRPLLQWVAEAVAAACDDVVIVRAAGQGLPHLDLARGFEVADDRYAERGPLAGLVSGFPRARHDACFAVSCDAPLLQPALIRLLADHLDAEAAAVIPRAAGYRQPLVAVYRRSRCQEPFEAALEAGEGRILAAVRGLAVREVSELEVCRADPELSSFRNANQPDMLAGIAETLRQRRP